MQRFKIAGLTVDIEIKYERLKKQGRPYEIALDSSPADITLNLNDVVMQRARKKFPNLSDENIEYLLYGFMFYDKLLDFDGMMLHASAVAIGGYAYLFSADSGVGKSTHTSYYLEAFGDRAVIINDDKPALRKIDGTFYCFGTPFSGKHDISINKGFKVGGICFLNRAEQNTIEKIDSSRAFKLIYRQTQSMNDSIQVEKRLDMLDKLLSSCDLYEMGCTNDVSAAHTSFNKMKKSIPVNLSEVSFLLEEQLNSGAKVKFQTKGRSMYPLLIDGRDSVTLERRENYSKNDVVLFKTANNEYVLHRIKKIENNKIITRGDALTKNDEPITKENIIATAVSFERNGKEIGEKNILYKLYSILYTSEIGLTLRKLRHKKMTLC